MFLIFSKCLTRSPSRICREESVLKPNTLISSTFAWKCFWNFFRNFKLFLSIATLKTSIYQSYRTYLTECCVKRQKTFFSVHIFFRESAKLDQKIKIQLNYAKLILAFIAKVDLALKKSRRFFSWYLNWSWS